MSLTVADVASLPVTDPRRLGAELANIFAPDGSIQASTDTDYVGMFFPRDALEFVRATGSLYPQIKRIVALRCASLQGLSVVPHPITEAERGKIPHQYIRRSLGMVPAPRATQEGLTALALQWRFAANPLEARFLPELLYYGAVDTTPQFVRVVAEICRAEESKDFLNAEYFHHATGARMCVREAVGLAGDWLLQRCSVSEEGFLTGYPINSTGTINQTLRDAALSTFHEDGSALNYTYPGVASLDVQAITFDALRDLSWLLEDDRFLKPAEVLQQSFLRFWMPDQSALAMALDHDKSGAWRQVETLSNIMGDALDSGILDGLDQQPEIVSSVVHHLFGPQFVTPLGPRTLALKYGCLYDCWLYQGSYTVWPVLVGRSARGFDRQGLPSLARFLDAGILAGARAADAILEAWYVDEHGNPAIPLYGNTGDGRRIVAAFKFNHGQAFALGDTIRAEWNSQRPAQPPQPGWREGLCREVLDGLALPGQFEPFPAWIDKRAGKAAEKALEKRIGFSLL